MTPTKYNYRTQINNKEVEHLTFMPVNYVKRQMIHRLIDDIPFEQLEKLFNFTENNNGCQTETICSITL